MEIPVFVTGKISGEGLQRIRTSVLHSAQIFKLIRN